MEPIKTFEGLKVRLSELASEAKARYDENRESKKSAMFYFNGEYQAYLHIIKMLERNGI